MLPDHGGWCAPDNAYCHCGQIFDEDHDRALCRDLMPPVEFELIDISDVTVKRGGVRILD